MNSNETQGKARSILKKKIEPVFRAAHTKTDIICKTVKIHPKRIYVH